MLFDKKKICIYEINVEILIMLIFVFKESFEKNNYLRFWKRENKFILSYMFFIVLIKYMVVMIEII